MLLREVRSAFAQWLLTSITGFLELKILQALRLRPQYLKHILLSDIQQLPAVTHVSNLQNAFERVSLLFVVQSQFLMVIKGTVIAIGDQ